MIEQLILVIAFVYLLITSILDVKYRLVWDYINYSFGFLFLIIRVLEQIIMPDYSAVLSVLSVSFLTLITGLFLYKTGAWGGGDLKLLTALSVGLSSLPSDKLVIISLTFPFYANFLINTLISGIIFGLLWSFIGIVRTKTYKSFGKFYWGIIILAILLVIISFFAAMKERILFLLIAVFCSYYVVKKFEDKITIIDKKVKKLDEGDWIIKEFRIKGKLITKKPTGLSKADIKLLQSSSLKMIKIKDGIPFLVSFFLAFLLTIVLKSNFITLIVTNM